MLQTIRAQPIKIDAVLPVGAGLAVDAARVPFMWLADEVSRGCNSAY
jgi:hypothetical protein